MDDNVKKQMLAMGFPSLRILLYALVKKYNKGNDYNVHIENICHIQEVGCLDIKYFNKVSNKQETAFIVLKECKADHDVSYELDKLRVHLNEEQWSNILKSLSFVILLTRSIYSSIYEENLDFIQNIVGNDVGLYNTVHVDPANTTLYLPDVEDRIGIFVECV